MLASITKSIFILYFGLSLSAQTATIVSPGSPVGNSAYACGTVVNVGTFYFRTDAASVNSSVFGCSQISAGVYQWENIQISSSQLNLLAQAVSTGNVSATAVLSGTSTMAGLYRISYYISPATSNALAVITGTMSFTDGGTAKSQTISGLALASLSNFIQGTMIVHVDASTNISFSDTVTGTAGTYNVYVVVTKIG